jgi:hypothetical protein
MAEQKTKPTSLSVDEFINSIPEEIKRNDAAALVQMMREITGREPKLWGSNIIGFGKYYYKYESGHEGYSLITGFSPRKQNFTIYLMAYSLQDEPLLEKLGKHKTGKGCLYIKKLSDIDPEILKELIGNTVKKISEKYIVEE